MKKLSKTRRLVTIGKDVSKCCNARLRQRAVWPFELCCTECSKDIKYEEQIKFKSNKPSYQEA